MKSYRNMKIVAAAVYHKGVIYGGLRHAVIMHWIWDEVGMENIPQEEQGFLTDTGVFLHRWQAGALAYMSGQTACRYTELLSEHLW